MSEEEKDEPPKIIVDEDWKQKVEAEKQALEDEIAQKAKELAGEAEEAGQGDAPEGADYDLPPASFPSLLQEFSTRALVSLGMMPNPFAQEAQVDLKAAAYSIDMLAVLQEKTEGNLEEQEAIRIAESSLTFDYLRKTFFHPAEHEYQQTSDYQQPLKRPVTS